MHELIGLLAWLGITINAVFAQVPLCADEQRQCPDWARYCFNNDYVMKNCIKTCRRCPKLSEIREQAFNDQQQQQELEASRQNNDFTPRFFAAPPLRQAQPATFVDQRQQFSNILQQNPQQFQQQFFPQHHQFFPPQQQQQFFAQPPFNPQFQQRSLDGFQQQQFLPQQQFQQQPFEQQQFQQQQFQQQQFLQQQQFQPQQPFQQQFQQPQFQQPQFQQQQPLFQQPQFQQQQPQFQQPQLQQQQPSQQQQFLDPQQQLINPQQQQQQQQFVASTTEAAPTTRVTVAPIENCVDNDASCNAWVSSSFSMCTNNVYIKDNCQKRCGYCGRSSVSSHPEYDLRRLPAELEPVAFLLGVWRSEHTGKARFPTIPVFTYGEEISFSIADDPRFGARSLNYTAFAFGINEAMELHSEYGFLAVQSGTDRVALTTVMNNGFTTVEEGRAIGGTLRLRLQDIGRISFSRDLPVHDMVREWRLIDANTLEQKLDMETLTHGMQEHTFIRYKKVFP